MTDPQEKSETPFQQTEVAELRARLRRVEAELREMKKSRDEWVVRFHSSRPTRAVRRKLHRLLDVLQSRTPNWLRENARPLYLRWYRRFFPYGPREFESADLASGGSSEPSMREIATEGEQSAGAAANGRSLSNEVIGVYPTYRPQVSIVLPVWNDDAFLSDSIKSVLAQTYRELELLVVDDGSTVDLSPILDRRRQDPRLRVIRRPHEGLASALNAGFREARGDFWTWTSADNLMKPAMIAALLDFLLRNPRIEMTYGNMDLIDSRGGPLTGSDVRLVNQRAHASHQLDLPHSIETLGLEEDNFVGACFLYRRSAARLAGEYDGTLLGTEDYDLWLRLSLAGEVRHVDTEECLYSYRVHKDSLTAKHGRGPIAENIRSILTRHGQRTAFFQRPCRISILWEAASGAPSDMAAGLAAALQQSGHAVTLFHTGTAGRDPAALPFCVKEVNCLGDAFGELGIRDSDSSDKTIVICFLEQPEAFGEYAESPEAASAVWFAWLPPDFPSEKITAKAGNRWGILCGSSSCRDRLPKPWRRTALLLPPGERAFKEDSKLVLKARDNRYPLDEFPQLSKPLAVYAGPLDDELVDAELVRAVAAQYPDLDFLLLSEAGQVAGSFSLNGSGPNLFCLENKPFRQWPRYLSRAALLLAPYKQAVARAGDIEDTLHCYLAAGKPILATEAARCVGLEDLPNAVIASEQGFCGVLPRALALSPNLEIADQYLSRRSAEQAARNLVSLANAALFAPPARMP